MKGNNLDQLQKKIFFFKIVYLTLFAISFILILLRSPAVLWASTLVAAIIIQTFISMPLTKKYKAALSAKDKATEAPKKSQKPKKTSSKKTSKPISKKPAKKIQEAKKKPSKQKSQNKPKSIKG